MVDALIGDACFACLDVIKSRNRHAPSSLARNAPLAASLNERFQTVSSALGNELNVFDRGERAIFDQRNVREPLCCRPCDDRLFCSPIDGVLV